MNEVFGGDLVALYHKEKRNNKLWYLSPKLKAGSLIAMHGIASLAVASELMDGSSEQMYLFYRRVYGLIQDELCTEGEIE